MKASSDPLQFGEPASLSEAKHFQKNIITHTHNKFDFPFHQTKIPAFVQNCLLLIYRFRLFQLKNRRLWEALDGPIIKLPIMLVLLEVEAILTRSKQIESNRQKTMLIRLKCLFLDELALVQFRSPFGATIVVTLWPLLIWLKNVLWVKTKN